MTRALVIGAALLALTSCADEAPLGATGATGPTVYEGDGLVLDGPDREPVLCLGAVADSLPPQCDGIALVAWDWSAVDGEETRSDTTWGSFHVVGTYEGSTFTIIEAGPPEPPVRTSGVPVDTPCPEPEGGWIAPDPSRATEDHMVELMHAVEAEPDSAGFWIDYVDEPVGEGPVEAGGIIAIAAFTGDLERHTAEIEQLWGGPLCLVEHARPYAELQQIQRELGEGVAGEIGLEVTWSSVDIQTNVVELGVAVADPVAEEALADRYGEGTVILEPALVPLEP